MLRLARKPRKTSKLSIRITEDQKKTIKKKAKRSRLTLSKYMIARALEGTW